MTLQHYDSINIIISEDISSAPQKIRFQEISPETDIVSLMVGVADRSDSFPIATTVVDMGNIITGKFLFIRPIATDITVAINGGAPITFLADKATRMWANFTSLSITATAITQVAIAIAG